MKQTYLMVIGVDEIELKVRIQIWLEQNKCHAKSKSFIIYKQ